MPPDLSGAINMLYFLFFFNFCAGDCPYFDFLFVGACSEYVWELLIPIYAYDDVVVCILTLHDTGLQLPNIEVFKESAFVGCHEVVCTEWIEFDISDWFSAEE